MKVTEKDREAALAITGPCSCDVAYTGRGLRAPDCRYCNDAEDVAKAIATAHARGLEDAAKAVRASLPRAHTYASESADLYRAQDAIIERAIAAICKLGEDK